MSIWQVVDDHRLQEIAKFALDGIAPFQTNFGSRENVGIDSRTEDGRLSEEGVSGRFGSTSSFRALEPEPEQDGIRDQSYPIQSRIIDSRVRGHRNGGS